MNLRKFFLLSLILLTVLSSQAQEANAPANQRINWFTQGRFGMFIHWGLYSAAEGLWKGERIRNGNNYAEWIRYRNRISNEEYTSLAKRFEWDKIDPEQWVLMAKKAGMKYIVITAKHHDGIAIWDTKVSEYSLPKLSGSHRDVIKELAAACKKYNMRLGFYYSHWLDWQHPYGWDHNQELKGRVTDEQYNKYWQEKVIPQLRELLTNYGDISLLWFDMWIDHKSTIVKKEQLDQVIKLTRELQPNCLINSRLGLPASTPGIDFETLGDNEFGAAYQNRPWETAGTIAYSWGYNALENQWKSTSQLLESLIDNVSLNGDFTLNIGPRADGSYPYEGTRRLDDIGKWLAKNGESIYGCAGIPFKAPHYDWGRITTKKVDGNKQMVYLHVYNWPLDGVLRLSGILSKPENIVLIQEDGKRESLSFKQSGPHTDIQLPAKPGDPFVSVIAIQYAQPVQTDLQVVAASSFGGYALTCRNYLSKPESYKTDSFDGVLPDRVLINKTEAITWKVYIPEAGKYSFDISCHNAATADVAATIGVNERQLSINLKPNGQVVVEPNQHNYTDEYLDNRAGTLQFDKPGYYDISLKLDLKAGQKVSLNRIWIDKVK